MYTFFPAPCYEEGVLYPGGGLERDPLVNNVTSFDHCSALCQARDDCEYWSWRSGDFVRKNYRHTCTLKKSKAREPRICKACVSGSKIDFDYNCEGGLTNQGIHSLDYLDDDDDDNVNENDWRRKKCPWVCFVP